MNSFEAGFDKIESKAAFRRMLRDCVEKPSPRAREAADRVITARVLKSAEYRAARTIFIYVSTASEPDTLPVIQDALKNGKQVCVPRCLKGHQMEAVRITALSDLQPGAYGIPEPSEGCITVPPERIDLAVIPCVAASEKRERLGHGAGYYDRYLLGVKACKMCLCFSWLLFSKIPTDPHDIPMDIVITDDGKEAR